MRTIKEGRMNKKEKQEGRKKNKLQAMKKAMS